MGQCLKRVPEYTFLKYPRKRGWAWGNVSTLAMAEATVQKSKQNMGARSYELAGNESKGFL
jgi:hypothetical protein